jgi:hypothetical protein
MKPKLFHTLVVMGAALTGGTVLVTACGGKDKCGQGPVTTDCYPHISYNPDGMAHIAFNPDALPNISYDSGTPQEAGDASDASDAQAAPNDAEAG